MQASLFPSAGDPWKTAYSIIHLPLRLTGEYGHSADAVSGRATAVRCDSVRMNLGRGKDPVPECEEDVAFVAAGEPHMDVLEDLAFRDPDPSGIPVREHPVRVIGKNGCEADRGTVFEFAGKPDQLQAAVDDLPGADVATPERGKAERVEILIWPPSAESEIVG